MLHFFVLLLIIHNYDVDSKDTEEEAKYKSYLVKYGYTDSYSSKGEKLIHGIKRFQYFSGLPMTGNLDAATAEQMSLSRCGLSDPDITIETRRKRKFILQGSKWRKNSLTWWLDGTGRTLQRNTILKVMREAFSIWSKVTNMDFTELDENTGGSTADILVKFVVRSHLDPYPFDGEGGVLAHAFYPHNNEGLSGDVHFDDEENYTYKSIHGRNLLWVATHELGHSLGMEHSNLREAVMYPFYTKYKPGFKLNDDDILGIQSLYGVREQTIETTVPSGTPFPKEITTLATTTTSTTTTPLPTTTKIPNSRACPEGTITAINYNPHYHIKIAFYDNDKLTLIGFDNLITRERREYIPKFHIPQPVDASFNVRLGTRKYAVYFSGNQYWVYYHQYFGYKSGPHSIYGNDPDDTNPVKLKLPTSVKKIDAIMQWKRNNHIYVFSGGLYWKLDGNTRTFDASRYPDLISLRWKGIPDNIDSAFSSMLDRKTYFIKGDMMYLYNDEHVTVENGYPKHIGAGLLDCGGRSSMILQDVGKSSDKSKAPSIKEP